MKTNNLSSILENTKEGTLRSSSDRTLLLRLDDEGDFTLDTKQILTEIKLSTSIL